MVSKTSSTSNKVKRRLSTGYCKSSNKNWRYAVAYQSIFEKFVMCHLHQLVKISEYNVVHE